MIREIEVKGFILEDGNKQPFYLRISEPTETENEDDFFCQIYCPYLFKVEKKIYGVNEDQARELAISFINSLLVNKEVIDEKGVKIVIK